MVPFKKKKKNRDYKINIQDEINKKSNDKWLQFSECSSSRNIQGFAK